MGFFAEFGRFFGFSKAKRYPDRDFKDLDVKQRYDALEPEKDGDKGKSGNVNDYLRLYRTHPTVYTCTRDVAQACANVEFQVLRDDKEINKKHPVYRVIKRPNKHETFTVFRERTFIHLGLTGNAFWEIVRDKKSQEIIGMYVLRPDWIKILPHKRQKVAGYIYEVPGQEKILLSTEDVVHLMYSDSEDEYWGISPAMAAQNSITVDLYATAYNKQYFTHGAEPGGVLESEFSITDKAYDRLIANWYKRHGSYKNAHIPAILEEGLKYKPITSTHRDMQFQEQRKLSKEEIYDCYDVPIDWRRDLKQKKSFYFSNIIPKLNWLAEVFNEHLLNPEGTEDRDRFEVKFITRSIEAMVEDEEIKSKIAQSNVSHGIMTINEVREKYYGLDKVEWGDVYWAPVGLAPHNSGLHPTSPTPGEGQEPGRTVTENPKTNGMASPNHVPSVGEEPRKDEEMMKTL